MGRLLREEDVQKAIYNLLMAGTIKPTSAMENYGLEETARLVVSNIPTAFDAEAVVKALEDLKCLRYTHHAIDKAIEIVRKGGVK